jgi:hypothetical protein
MAPRRPRGRVELRPPAEADAEELPAMTIADVERAAIVRREDGRALGALAYRTADGWLAIEGVALTDEARIGGYGAEAVGLLEEAAGAGAKRFGFAVPKSDGLALYFALRLGYRPAAPGESLWYEGTRRDIIAMVRSAGGRD